METQSPQTMLHNSTILSSPGMQPSPTRRSHQQLLPALLTHYAHTEYGEHTMPKISVGLTISDGIFL